MTMKYENLLNHMTKRFKINKSLKSMKINLF
jgi:hypothetical protein